MGGTLTLVKQSRMKRLVLVSQKLTERAWHVKVQWRLGPHAGLGNSFSHGARATGVAIIVSNSMGVKLSKAACLLSLFGGLWISVPPGIVLESDLC